MVELRRITKRELARVGIRPDDENAAEWMHRGWCELIHYLWKCDQVEKVQRVFEEDGA